MPHRATDEYIRNFAAMVRDGLRPDVARVYVELGNELWHPGTTMLLHRTACTQTARADRQIHRQADRQTDGQADRQIFKQKDRHLDI